MLRKCLLVFLWSPLCLVLLFYNVLLLHNPTQPIDVTQAEIVSALPLSDNSQRMVRGNTGKVLGATITGADARTQLLERFLENSPLLPYADLMVKEADLYGIDFRLVPAIGMCESNLGKRIPSSDSYNAFGIAVYTGQQHGAKFKNWEEALKWVFNFIDKRFISRNIIDIKQIGGTWAPPSLAKDNSWANCVESFMRRIQ